MLSSAQLRCARTRCHRAHACRLANDEANDANWSHSKTPDIQRSEPVKHHRHCSHRRNYVTTPLALQQLHGSPHEAHPKGNFEKDVQLRRRGNEGDQKDVLIWTKLLPLQSQACTCQEHRVSCSQNVQRNPVSRIDRRETTCRGRTAFHRLRWHRTMFFQTASSHQRAARHQRTPRHYFVYFCVGVLLCNAKSN